jgi:hypothetical protein
VKSAGTGLKEIAKDSNGRPIYSSGSGSGTSVGSGSGYGYGSGSGSGYGAGAGIDNYSYYGALPTKGANFMPITADFSAFSK